MNIFIPHKKNQLPYMDKVLLIGNDINNATGTYSWENLINGLMDYAKVDPAMNLQNKPFPMLYEEIYLNAVKAHGASEARIKKFIASQTRNMQPNELHSLVLGLGIKNILTTNYDLCFEKTAALTEQSCRNEGTVREKIFNLFRHHKAGEHNIWHIHGSQTLPGSITLGYEHYGGYLQQMRNYIVSGTQKTYTNKNYYSLGQRFKENKITHESWIDFLFTHDVHIFGLNLDFVEMHLWWLLSYRARVIVEGRFPVTNKIYYYYPAKYEEKSRNKLEMFRVSEVQTVPIKNHDNKLEYYKTVIKKIRRS
ncbi:MAG: SIR2 family protein [Bacteroidia bacterium]